MILKARYDCVSNHGTLKTNQIWLRSFLYREMYTNKLVSNNALIGKTEISKRKLCGDMNELFTGMYLDEGTFGKISYEYFSSLKDD